MQAYIFDIENPNYEMFNMIILANSEEEAWKYAKEYTDDPRLHLLIIQELKPGILDVCYYIE